MNVLNDLRVNILVQPLYKVLALHHEVLLDSRRGDFDIQHSILYKNLLGVLADNITHDSRPRLNDAVLIVGSLQAVDAQELLYEIAYGFRLFAFHECDKGEGEGLFDLSVG